MKVNKIDKATQGKINNRTLIGLILLVLVLPLVYLGGWFIVLLVMVISLFIVNEFLNINKDKKYFVLTKVFIIVETFLIIFWIFIKNNLISENLNFHNWTFINNLTTLEVSTIGVATLLGGLFLFHFADKNLEINDVTYLFLMAITIGLSLQAILFLRFFPEEIYIADHLPRWRHNMLIIYVALATFATDIGAYFVGIIFGKNKLNPRISPKKTWEGFFGGIIFSIILSMAMALILGAFKLPILPFLDVPYWYNILLLSVTIPLFANIGDLLFSALKRHFHTKDYSHVLGEHGGFLDRFDSLLISALFSSMMVILINHGWNLLA